MKSKIITWIFIGITTIFYAQKSPTLELTGTKPSLTKGTIDTELLSQIIQEKQEEIKQRVFRNTIIAQFNKYPYTERLNNFTTYNYLYKLMDVLTSGKNKTVMTKSITENTAEFAFIYGLILYASNSTIEDSKVIVDDKQRIKIRENEIEEFNIYIDMCLDILLTSNEDYLKHFNFKETLSNNYYKRWYTNDNKYLKFKSDPNWITKRTQLETKIKAFFDLVDQLNTLYKKIDSSEEIKTLFNDIVEMDIDEFDAELEKVETNINIAANASFQQELSNIRSALTSIKGYSDNTKDNIMHLLNFYKGLKKSNFRDFTLEEDQFYAMKFIMTKFIDQARAQYKNNDIIASVLDFLLENTLVEFKAIEADNEEEEKGYLFMDIESLISSIDNSFGSVKNKGILNYVTPFLSIGTNYASFGDSDIMIESNGQATTLSHLYYASEKIGIKYKVWNWKYTRSFRAGESFDYYGFKDITWRRPQQEPLVSDLYIFGYGSGLLYNLIDVKSESEFDYAIFGAGVGITFFNGLSVNASIASPLINKKLDNSFFNVGLDIPIIDYISALSKKNK